MVCALISLQFGETFGSSKCRGVVPEHDMGMPHYGPA